MLQIDTGYKDKKGKKIYLGQYAVTIDREGNKWIGIIEVNNANNALFMNEGKYVSRIFIYKSNMNVWLHNYWTETKLEVIRPTDKVINKYNNQKNLKWGYYYSKKTLKNYYKNISYMDIYK